MSVLRSSIENLHSKIVKLENAVVQLEGSMQGQQRDMFSAAPSNENGAQNVDKKAISVRLDSAIEKVEQLLKDGTS